MKSTQFIPFNNLVLAKRIKAEDKTKGGIFLPNADKELKTQAIVVKVSDNVKNKTLATGDTVCFKEFAGTQISFEDQACILLNEEEILGKIV